MRFLAPACFALGLFIPVLCLFVAWLGAAFVAQDGAWPIAFWLSLAGLVCYFALGVFASIKPRSRTAVVLLALASHAILFVSLAALERWFGSSLRPTLLCIPWMLLWAVLGVVAPLDASSIPARRARGGARSRGT